MCFYSVVRRVMLTVSTTGPLPDTRVHISPSSRPNQPPEESLSYLMVINARGQYRDPLHLFCYTSYYVDLCLRNYPRTMQFISCFSATRCKHGDYLHDPGMSSKWIAMLLLLYFCNCELWKRSYCIRLVTASCEKQADVGDRYAVPRYESVLPFFVF